MSQPGGCEGTAWDEIKRKKEIQKQIFKERIFEGEIKQQIKFGASNWTVIDVVTNSDTNSDPKSVTISNTKSVTINVTISFANSVTISVANSVTISAIIFVNIIVTISDDSSVTYSVKDSVLKECRYQ